MILPRRQFLLSGAAFTFAACSQTPSRAQSVRPVSRAENPAFRAWVADFDGRAAAAGISPATRRAAFANIAYLPEVVERDRNQIEVRRSFEDYLSITVSDERLAKGRAALAQNAATLTAIEQAYGVDRRIITAIWGIESRYGERRGDIPVISSTATLAFDGRRGRFYEAQLIAALRILDRGDTTPDRMKGSWAGAMGHTQFIPTSFEGFAVDFTGDGRRDIWGEDPTDALASTGQYLSRKGWRTRLAWGREAGAGGPSERRIVPQEGGVAFDVTRNFDVLKTYNNSDFYAIAVGHLADRIGGAGPLRGRFPPDANGLTKADRMNVQRGLIARGYDIGTVDGVLGRQSTAAITAFQQSVGLPVDGIAGPEVLARLR